MKNKNLLLILIATVSAVVFFGLINWLMYQSQAAADKVNITIAPQESNVNLNQENEISIILAPENPANKLSAVNLHLSGENVNFTTLGACEGLAGEPASIFSELKSASSGNAAQKSCAVFKQGNELPGAIKIKANFKCINSGPAKISINTGKSQVTGNIPGVAYVFGKVDQYSFNCGSGGEIPQGPMVKARFEPSECQTEVGKICSYKLTLDGSGPLSAYYLKLKYDPRFVDVKSILSGQKQVLGASRLIAQSSTLVTPTPGASLTGYPTLTPMVTIPTNATPTATIIPTTTIAPLPTSGGGEPIKQGCFEILNKVDSDAGVINLIYACLAPKDKLTNKFQIGIDLVGKKDGIGMLAITDGKVVGPVAGYLYQLDKSEAKYIIGKGGTGATVKTKFEMTLRLQGVTKKPTKRSAIKARIGLGDGALKEPIYKTVEFTVDDKGLWRGSVEFDVPQMGGYKLLVKGEQHLQKKVCVDKPTEDYPGAYSCDKGKITIKGGTQIFDLSNIIMLVGDFNPQDGLNNAYDQALVRNAIGKCDDSDTVKLVDVNYDGCVNAIDHSLMIAALSIRYDEK